jgi:hypothetical protein
LLYPLTRRFFLEATFSAQKEDEKLKHELVVTCPICKYALELCKLVNPETKEKRV